MTVVLDPAPVPPDGVPDELLRTASIVTPNEHEAALLVGAGRRRQPRSATAAPRGAETVIVTLGRSRGAAGRVRPATGPPRRRPVTAVDTTGAGDAFNGALAAALAEGHDLATAIEWALAAGALAVTRPGAQEAMPRRAEVRALLGR